LRQDWDDGGMRADTPDALTRGLTRPMGMTCFGGHERNQKRAKNSRDEPEAPNRRRHKIMLLGS
jgi:hypothetical protein